MPFKSDAQRRYLYSQHPDVAKGFAKETPKGADLPEHVRRKDDAERRKTREHAQMNRLIRKGGGR